MAQNTLPEAPGCGFRGINPAQCTGDAEPAECDFEGDPAPSKCSVITTHCHAIAQQAVVGVVEVGRGGSESPQESQRDLCPLYSLEGPFDNTQGPRAAILIGKRRGCLEKWRNLCLRYHS